MAVLFYFRQLTSFSVVGLYGGSDIMKDDKFWESQLDNPADLYHWAISCTHLSRAHTTPVVRSADHPEGDLSDPATLNVNALCRRVAQLILKFLSLEYSGLFLVVVLSSVPLMMLEPWRPTPPLSPSRAILVVEL